MFFYTFKEYLRHFNSIFDIFYKLNIILKFSKIYLKYLIITLLKQKVNNLNFSISINKLNVIFKLKFLKTLIHLKTYLEKIN